MKYIRFNCLVSILILIFSIANAQKKKPIVIEDQGSFAVGGSVKINPGTFDPVKRTPEGQNVSWRSCLRVLSDPGECKKTSDGVLAWYRPIFQNLGNYT